MEEKKLKTTIYIDYENVHYNFINNFKNVFELNFFQKLRRFLDTKGFAIIDTTAYCNFDIKDMHQTYHQTKLQQIGIDTRHTTNNGKNYADIQITTDVSDIIHNNEYIDCIILISNDKDMTPLVKSIRKTNKTITLILFKDNFDKVLLEYPNSHYFIEDIMETELENVEDFKEDIYKNMKDYLDGKHRNTDNPYLWSFERYLDSTSKWFKLFDYEILRYLSILERDNKIFFYKYDLNGKEHIGLATTEHKQKYESNGNITIINNYISSEIIQEQYKKYNKFNNN